MAAKIDISAALDAEMKKHLEEIQTLQAKLKVAAGGSEAQAAIQKQIAELHQNLAQSAKTGGHAQVFVYSAGVAEGPQVEGLKQKAEALQQAAARLKEAGLADQANELAKQAEKIRAEAEHVRARIPAIHGFMNRAEGGPIELHRQISELTEQVRALRKEVGELRGLLEKKP